MKVRIQQIVFSVLTLLAVDLILNVINNQVQAAGRRLPSEIVTILGMVVIAFVLYSAVTFINRASAYILRKAMDIGQVAIAGRMGAFLILFLLTALLYAGFHFTWFGRWPKWKVLIGFFS